MCRGPLAPLRFAQDDGAGDRRRVGWEIGGYGGVNPVVEKRENA